MKKGMLGMVLLVIVVTLAACNLVMAIDAIDCDLNGDHIVDMKDISAVATAFGSYPGHSRWNATVDINQDGKVDLKDIVWVAFYFGSSV